MRNNYSSWGREYADGITEIGILSDFGLVDEPTLKRSIEIKQNFDVRVPVEFAEAMRTEKDRALRKQFIPSSAELDFAAEELVDPIGDEAHTPVPYLTHRYPDRVLLKVTYTCGVYCRFCFRRYKVSEGSENPSLEELQHAIGYMGVS